MATTPSVPMGTACVSRRDALQKLPLAALGILSAGLTTWDGSARAGTATVPESLNLVLGIAYLQAELYTRGLTMPAMVLNKDRKSLQQISKQEGAHVATLKAMLGSDAAPKPTFDLTGGAMLPDVLTNYMTFLGLAQALEDMSVRAYKGQLPALRSDAVPLAALIGMHSVEGRHAAVVRRIRGENSWITGIENDVPLAAPLTAAYAGEDNHVQAGVDVGLEDAASEAFDEPMTREQVLAITAPFIVA